MTLNEFLSKLASSPQQIEFTDTMTVIDNNYDFIPSGFNNHGLLSEANENNGSCKIFAFAQLNNLSEMETLSLFGRYYRDDVMGNPDGDDHSNIRNFLLDGWLGVHFDKVVLHER